MGKFDTEIDLTSHNSIRECLRYAKLIGLSNDEQDLIKYSNRLLGQYIREQLQFFPNSMWVLITYILSATNLLDSIIIRNEMPIEEMPSVQLTALFAETEEKNKKCKDEIRANMIKAARLEIGNHALENCSVPSS